MSRCFPFPPPGYVRNGVPGEALIESIKLQKGKEKSKTERSKEKKEKKREKKEKKREKKRKEQEKPTDDTKISKLDIKSHQGEKCREDSYLKGREDEAEQLERSSLTEEHEPPIYSQSLCLSDSTQSSNKRKRHTSPSTSSQTHGGNIIRIKLPLQKHREADASLKQAQPCSTSGRANNLSEQKQKLRDQEQCSLNNLKTASDVKELPPRSGDGMSHSTAEKDKIFAQAEAAFVTKKPHKDETKWMELCSKMEDLVPLTLQSEQNDIDDQWLFEKKHRDGLGPKRFRADNDVSCGGSVTLWPRAHHLIEAEIYALPYTVPF